MNPVFALFAGMMAVATGAVFARLADAPALTIAAYRVGLATLMLAPAAWFASKKEIFSLSRKDLWTASGAGLFLALHFAAWISSLEHTSVANSVVLVNTNPIWVGILSPIITKDRIDPANVFSIAVSITGGVIMAYGDFTSGSDVLFGDTLAIIGGIFMAGYLLLGRKVRQKLSLIGYIFICYGSAAIILWGAVLCLGLKASGFSHGTWLAFFAMALFTQLVGHTSYNWALKWFPPGLIALSLLGEPIGSTILAFMVFDEGLTWTKALGGALVLLGIIIAARHEIRKG